MNANQIQKNFCNQLRRGTTIIGKWHDEQYVIKEKLGSGAIGTVYLCEHNGQQVALKISSQSASITTEVNVLKELQRVQGSRLGPYLLDVDDFVTPTGTYSFYVMEYLRGSDITTFIKVNGDEWVGVLLIQLLDDLEQLHQSGWVFGDLKTENLIVMSTPPKVRFIDVGGTTRIGRSIKEYTEFYDRGYWGMGTRRADPGYDLFALVLVLLAVYYPKRFQKEKHSEQLLFAKIDKVPALRPFGRCLKKAIAGEYQTSNDMKKEVVQLLYSRQRRRSRKKDQVPFIIESCGITFLAISYYLISLWLP